MRYCINCGLKVAVAKMKNGNGFCPWCEEYTVDLQLSRETLNYINKVKVNNKKQDRH
ncbi:hypothetical protein AB4Y30_01645 [Ornithinibacillus sp. 4-3]|uniref:Uncharacterized protein n=1 Tax=Ornithinibacillus sp. 4-3 TaxID=3231488 RepID=A0AB39HSB3_9BACI